MPRLKRLAQYLLQSCLTRYRRFRRRAASSSLHGNYPTSPVGCFGTALAATGGGSACSRPVKSACRLLNETDVITNHRRTPQHRHYSHNFTEDQYCYDTSVMITHARLVDSMVQKAEYCLFFPFFIPNIIHSLFFILSAPRDVITVFLAPLCAP